MKEGSPISTISTNSSRSSECLNRNNEEQIQRWKRFNRARKRFNTLSYHHKSKNQGTHKGIRKSRLLKKAKSLLLELFTSLTLYIALSTEIVLKGPFEPHGKYFNHVY